MAWLFTTHEVVACSYVHVAVDVAVWGRPLYQVWFEATANLRASVEMAGSGTRCTRCMRYLEATLTATTGFRVFSFIHV